MEVRGVRGKDVEEVQKIVKIILRNFGLGYGIKSFGTLMYYVIMKKSREGVELKDMMNRILGMNSVKYGLFLSSLTGSFHVTLYIMERIMGRSWKSSFIAGSVSGLSLMFIDPKIRRSIAVMFSERVFFMLLEPHFKPNSSKLLVILFCTMIAISQYAFFYEPECLDSGFYKSLYSNSTKYDQYSLSYYKKTALDWFMGRT